VRATLKERLTARMSVGQWVWGLSLFAAAYAIINWYMLIHTILYRLAVADYWTVLTRSGVMAFQAVSLLAAIVLLPRKGVALVLALVLASTWLNLGYGLILNEIIDPGQLSWLMSETGQASASAREFARPVVGGLLLSLTGVGLLVAARRVLRPAASGLSHAWWIGILALVAPVLALDLFSRWPVAAERNGYVYLAELAGAQPPPARAQVPVRPATPPRAEKIVWLIDESIMQSAFAKLIMPSAKPFDPIDFGEAHSFSNCSAPSNVALRSGVDVLHATPALDLRRTPSIWGYAHRAGYRTILIDGQSVGPLQNLILAPERALIDQFEPAKQGLKTDLLLARRVNALLKQPGRAFIYVVLRGAHFQYHDNYPANTVPESSPIAVQYENAVRFSKNGFFPTILDGVDRDRTALFYTSDHGQNIAPDVLPHCSVEPDPKEFSVPLIAFLPPAIRGPYKTMAPGQRSHSQIFPTSLVLMGYPETHAETYDANLTQPSKRTLWFGRNVTPLETGAPIQLHTVKRP
jgi:Sulfatase